jgi:hypothetical protein
MEQDGAADNHGRYTHCKAASGFARHCSGFCRPDEGPPAASPYSAFGVSLALTAHALAAKGTAANFAVSERGGPPLL